MTSHVFGARSSPSVVNFCLRKTAEDYGHLYDDKTTTILLRNFYVDNLLKSFHDEARCVTLINDLINVCRDGGFRLNQWTANNKCVLATVPEGERDDSVAVLDLSKDKLPTERALGIHWDMNDDNFTFRGDVRDKPYTRRGVLSVVASLYDPLGLVSPFTLLGSKPSKRCAARKLSWDEKMSDTEVLQWEAWLQQFTFLPEFKLRRSLIPPAFGEGASFQLHHFSDASQTGYGVASYLRVVSTDGEVHCTLLMGRARVAPLKRLSIPRAEFGGFRGGSARL
ncbi:uncharacterized protein [Macrobrachium rosenbergii]|uniref:uncharacterized protein n=1 Tax=Macrobrachium rosenbergii TaxID=79674 RepID=UPI0034D7ADB5